MQLTTNATPQKMITTINEKQSKAADLIDKPAQWSITRSTNPDVATNATIIVALTGAFAQGETSSVDLRPSNGGRKRSNYTDTLTAISMSVAGNPDLSFDLFTDKLTYTSPRDGASMTDLVISLPPTNKEDAADFSLCLSNATRSTNSHAHVGTNRADISASSPNDNQRTVLTGNSASPLSGINLTAEYRVSNAHGSRSPSVAPKSTTANVITLKHKSSNTDTGNTQRADSNTKVSAVADLDKNEVVSTSRDGTAMTDSTPKWQFTDSSLTENTVITTGELLKPSHPDNAPSLWSITGPAMIVDGDDAAFTISLGGQYQAGQSMSADINLIGINTSGNDFNDVISAITSATETDPCISFDGATLKFTAAANDTAMTDLIIVLTISADAINEESKLFSVGLTHATSNTNIPTSIAPGTQSVFTCVNASPIAIVDTNHTTVNTRLSGNIPFKNGALGKNPPTVSLVNGKPVNAAITTATGGTIAVTPDGQYDYNPATSFTGQDNIIIEALDATGQSTESILSIEISHTNTTQQSLPPSKRVTAKNASFNILEFNQSSSAALVTETNSDSSKENPTELNADTETAPQVADLQGTDTLESPPSAIGPPSSIFAPTDHHPVDISPAKQPPVESQRFSTDKQITGTTSTVANDDHGKIVFESFIIGDDLNINVSHTIADQHNDISRYSATLRNGQSLPTWITFNQEGSFIINRSIDTDVITLRLIAMHNSGARTSVLFDASKLTGEVYIHEDKIRPLTSMV